jgi:hypothetical protein
VLRNVWKAYPLIDELLRGKFGREVCTNYIRIAILASNCGGSSLSHANSTLMIEKEIY